MRHAGQHLGLRDVGRHDERAAAAAPTCMAATASSSSSRSPLFAIITGSTTTSGSSSVVDGRGHRLDDGRVGEHAGLHGVDADVAGDGLDLRGDEIGRQRQRRR